MITNKQKVLGINKNAESYIIREKNGVHFRIVESQHAIEPGTAQLFGIIAGLLIVIASIIIATITNNPTFFGLSLFAAVPLSVSYRIASEKKKLLAEFSEKMWGN